MKTLNVFFATIFILLSFSTFSQQGINFKALIKDSGGNVVANQDITVQFQILQGAGMVNVYQETHNPMTDANGIVIVNIGEGTPDSGDYNTIDWGSDDHYLNVQIDTGSGLTDMGTTQFMAVPYALHSNSVSSNSIKINDLMDGKSDDDGTQDGSSIFIGVNAGLNDDSSNNQNVGIGFESLKYSITGWKNTAIGYQSLNNNIGGISNTATGFSVLFNNTSGHFNSAHGSQALYFNTSGSNNTAMGNLALFNNSTGNFNTAHGSEALYSNTIGALNTAIGNGALYINTEGDNNTALGFLSLRENTLGNKNTAVGVWSLRNNTIGSENVANGHSALYSNTEGTNNVASGYEALYSNIDADKNTAIGYQSLRQNTEGFENTAIGAWSLKSNTLGNSNTANGAYALFSNTIGSVNTTTGAWALHNNTEGGSNVAFGYRALYENITGNTNTALGNFGLTNNTTGSWNTANGYEALKSNTISSYNTANGSRALFNNIDGENNTAVGNKSGYSSLGNANVFIGNEAGYFETGNNTLYIENSNADAENALIYGQFGTDNTVTGNILRTNSEFQIGNPTGTGYAFPTSDGILNQVLQTDGNGSLSWATTVQPTGLEAIDEGNGIGWRLIGANPDNFGNIGLNAIDFSYISNASSTMGATGNYSLAAGFNTTASQLVTTSMGYNTSASADYSTAIGYHTHAESYASTALGRYNIGGGDPINWVSTDPLFEIGNGSSDGSRTNALTVLKNGTITAPGFSVGEINTAGNSALITKEYADTNYTPTGLEALDEGNGIGWRLIGSNPTQYGNIGLHSVDLSRSDSGFNTDAGASGYNATAMGYVTEATGNYSTAMGLNTKATALNSTAIGKQNIGGGDPVSWVGSDPLFEIGNGNGVFSNALTVLKNGTITAPSFDISEITDTKALITKEYLEANTASKIDDLTDAKSDNNGSSIFLGINAGLNDDGTDNKNSAIGFKSLYSNILGDLNSANGYEALYSNTSGSNNVAIGAFTLYDNSDGSHNTAIGRTALTYNTSGSNNTAIGSQAMNWNNTGANNVALGYASLYGNTSGNFNTVAGYQALYKNTTADENTVFGYQAMYNNTTGYANTAVGFGALLSNTLGFRNSALGYRALSNVTTGDNNTAIGYDAQVPNATSNNQVRIGNSAVSYAGVQVAWTVTSDKLWKKDIRKLPYGLDLVSRLNPVDYIRKNNENDTREMGFIAQDVEKVLKELGYNDQGFLTKDDDGRISLRYNDFIALLTKAIQEQKDIIETQKKELNSHKSEINSLTLELTNIQERQKDILARLLQLETSFKSEQQ